MDMVQIDIQAGRIPRHIKFKNKAFAGHSRQQCFGKGLGLSAGMALVASQEKFRDLCLFFSDLLTTRQDSDPSVWV